MNEIQRECERGEGSVGKVKDERSGEEYHAVRTGEQVTHCNEGNNKDGE